VMTLNSNTRGCASVFSGNNTLARIIIASRLVLFGDGTALAKWILVSSQSQAKSCRVDFPMRRQKECRSDWYQVAVKDPIENKLGIWCDDITSLGHSPANGIDHPEKQHPSRYDVVEASNIPADRECKLSRDPGKVVDQEQPTPDPEGIIPWNAICQWFFSRARKLPGVAFHIIPHL